MSFIPYKVNNEYDSNSKQHRLLCCNALERYGVGIEYVVAVVPCGVCIIAATLACH